MPTASRNAASPAEIASASPQFEGARVRGAPGKEGQGAPGSSGLMTSRASRARWPQLRASDASSLSRALVDERDTQVRQEYVPVADAPAGQFPPRARQPDRFVEGIPVLPCGRTGSAAMFPRLVENIAYLVWPRGISLRHGGGSRSRPLSGAVSAGSAEEPQVHGGCQRRQAAGLVGVLFWRPVLTPPDSRIASLTPETSPARSDSRISAEASPCRYRNRLAC